MGPPGGQRPYSAGPSRPPNRSGDRRDRDRGRYSDQVRVNDRIRAPRVRVVEASTEKQLGILPTAVAIREARDRGLDLVEVSPNADPPVCKIIDYGKWKYIQEKHKKEAHKAHKASRVKEMKFRVGIDPHDYLIKITHTEDFLADGHKVRIQLQFRGRQMAHQELGHHLAAKIKGDLLTMGHVDMEPKQAGRNINMSIAPNPERQRVRKFRSVSKPEQNAHIPHANDVDQSHNAHDADDHQHPEDDHHDDHPAPAAAAEAAAPAPAPEAAPPAA